MNVLKAHTEHWNNNDDIHIIIISRCHCLRKWTQMHPKQDTGDVQCKHLLCNLLYCHLQSSDPVRTEMTWHRRINKAISIGLSELALSMHHCFYHTVTSPNVQANPPDLQTTGEKHVQVKKVDVHAWCRSNSFRINCTQVVPLLGYVHKNTSECRGLNLSVWGKDGI